MKLQCTQKGLWGGPVFVEQAKYDVGPDGMVEVGDAAAAKELLKCPGWREVPSRSAVAPKADKPAPKKPPRVRAKKEE